MRHRGGFTLVELIVASTLALVVLLVGFQLFLPAMRAWTDGQKRSEVSQGLLVTTNWIGDDVLRSSPGSLGVTPEGALFMRSSQGQRDSGETRFDQFVVYWVSEGELFRSYQTLNENDPLPSTAASVLNSLPNKRRLSSNVTRFTATVVRDWQVNLYLAVDKLGRQGEIRTAFTSVYAPFDLEIAEEES